jgi:molybdopterin synthase catalytic subunit
MSCITPDPIDLSALRAEVDHPSCGATVLMTGQVREEHQGRRVERLEYHAYHEMAEDVLEAVVAEVIRDHEDVRMAARHRVGSLDVGEVSVAVAAAAPHRAEAFAACQACIDALKERLPVWKKEFGPDGEVWQEETPLDPPGPPEEERG